MKIFNSVEKKAVSEIVIKKSRFIAHVFPVNTEDEALYYLQEVREEHRDAAHNVFAWQVGIEKTLQRCSDDGEPSGTAGKPVLEVIKQNGLTNILIVVTRYFGGTKLGASGLIRAYRQAAKAGIEKARIVKKAYHDVYRIAVGYPFWGQVQRELESWGSIENVSYTERVEFSILIPRNRSLDFERKMREAAGDKKIKMEKIGQTYSRIK